MPRVKPGQQASDPWLKRLKPPAQYDMQKWIPLDPRRAQFETAAEAEARQTAMVKTLRAGPQCVHEGLADRMEGCDKGSRCALMIDPACARIWRRNYVWRAVEAIHTFQPDTPLTFVTLVSTAGQFEPGSLDSFSIKNHQDRLKTRLLRSELGDVLAIGAQDLSYNEDAAGNCPPYWQWHDHIIFFGCGGETIRERLERYYPITDTILKPIQVAVVDDLLGALSYTYKAGLFRRVSVIDRRGHRNTLPPKPIKGPQLRELALALSKMSFSDRLFLRGFRRRGAILVPEK